MVHLLWPVEGDGLMGPGVVVFNPVVFCPLGQGGGVVDLVNKEAFVFQGAESTFTRSVLTGCLVADVHMLQLRMLHNKTFEPERAKRATVIGYQSQGRQDFTSLLIHRAVVGQWATEKALVVG